MIIFNLLLVNGPLTRRIENVGDMISPLINESGRQKRGIYSNRRVPNQIKKRSRKNMKKRKRLHNHTIDHLTRRHRPAKNWSREQ